MVKNTTRIDKTDVFHAGLVQGASFSLPWGMPQIKTSDALPEKIVPFHQASKRVNSDIWLYFYTDDYRFEPIWKNPEKYANLFQQCRGVITPDFSVYRNMPKAIQIWNTYRNRVLGYWIATLGVDVIPNVRWSDEFSYEFCFDGVELNKTVSIANHGCYKERYSKKRFRAGFYEMLNRLNPSNIILYGTLPSYVVDECNSRGIQLITFPSEFALSRMERGA